MKIAIVCDWLVAVGGAERVLYHLIECFPEADLFATVDFFDESARASILKNKTVTTTYLQKFPFAKKYYRQYLPFMPIAIEQLDVSEYDLIISSSHAVAKGVITGPNQCHISYVHSPMRYAWDLQHQYLKEAGLDKGIKRIITQYILHKMRAWDLRTANGVDHFAANSHFIARRIWKTYRREAQVIYPPVDLEHFTPLANKEDFYLTASRLVPYKKIELIVESFNAMPDKKLIVIGDGPDMNKIKQKAASNIEILGYQSREKLTYYMQRAKAFVFAALEDFGIVPIEAQACGTPVIAYGEGGCTETIRGLDHLTPSGVFFYEQTPTAICEAIKTFEANEVKFSIDNCTLNAARFSANLFRENFTLFVQNKLAEGATCA